MTTPRLVRDEPVLSQLTDAEIQAGYDLAGMPNAHDLARRQMSSAVKRIDTDSSTFPRFTRCLSVHDLAGAMAPGELWVFGARQGNGKSLFLQNLHDDLISQEVPTLYIGLEQGPDVLRIKHACLRAGVPARLILKADASDRGSLAYRDAYAKMRAELEWLDSAPIRELAFFSPTPYVNRDELRRWTTGAVKKYGVQCVIVDHIDHMENGTGWNTVSDLKETVKEAKMLARTNEIPMLVASQVKRPGDRVDAHTPPAAEDLAGCAGKEQIADVVMTLWRPLRTDMDPKALRELMSKARHGSVAGDEVFQSGRMGVRVAKDRLGDAPGKQTTLRVENGRLADLYPRTAPLRPAYGGHA